VSPTGIQRGCKPTLPVLAVKIAIYRHRGGQDISLTVFQPLTP